jgi:hypothetical protein
VLLWALKPVVIDRLSIVRVATSLGAWHAVHGAVLVAGRQLLIEDPARLDAMGKSVRSRRQLTEAVAGSGRPRRGPG